MHVASSGSCTDAAKGLRFKDANVRGEGRLSAGCGHTVPASCKLLELNAKVATTASHAICRAPTTLKSGAFASFK